MILEFKEKYFFFVEEMIFSFFWKLKKMILKILKSKKSFNFFFI